MLHNISELQHVLTTQAEIWGPLRGASRTARETQAAESAKMTAITSRRCKDRRMTHSDFNHLLSSLKALSPEQMRQLRQQIDSQLAQPKKLLVQAAAKGAKRAKPAAPKRSRQRPTSLISDCSRKAASPRFPIPPWTSTMTTPTMCPSSSRENRYRKPSSASGAEVATAYFVDSSALVKRYVQETGTSWVRGITRRRPSTHIYIAIITAVEVTSAVARRRAQHFIGASILDPLAVPQAPCRAIHPLGDHARPGERCHEVGECAPASRLRRRAVGHRARHLQGLVRRPPWRVRVCFCRPRPQCRRYGRRAHRERSAFASLATR